MTKRKYTFWIIITLLFVTGLLFTGFFHKQKIGFVTDKLGLTKNHFNIQVDKDIQPFIYIYWTSETIEPARENSLLVYHRYFQPEHNNFPVYGKNRFPIAWNDEIIYNRIGLFRYSPMNHTYDIHISRQDNQLIINWNIHNWYDPEIIQGCDTVNIPIPTKER